MTALQKQITSHYDTGAMLDRIKAALKSAGADPDHPAPSDLKYVDEFHLGGLEATEALLEPLAIKAGMRVLDIGSGIGGTTRLLADRYGVKARGVDLTPAFVELARQLSGMCGLAESTSYTVGSAYDLPVEDASIDLATMLHVGMNIDDKPAVFREVARVLAPGGRFAVFDLMERNGEPHDFPVPWASGPQTSFVEKPDIYREAAEAAGLRLVAERDRYDFATAFFKKVMAAMEESGPPPMGLHLIMGDEAETRYGNAAAAVMTGKIAPWEMVFQKAAA